MYDRVVLNIIGFLLEQQWLSDALFLMNLLVYINKQWIQRVCIIVNMKG
ncbi:hypothetical protein [Alkalihalobacillus sp. LMS39]|nr:hypothetical protein [Alkalihalobacillus sp. LMS39]UOE94955.1 hypothetical protein MM271_04700 [Alkalihalobacillus sp. LMS39]